MDERGAQPAGTASDTSARRTAFTLSWLAYATYYLGRKGLSVVKPALATELGFDTATLAWIDTAFLATYALGQVPSGLLTDRFGARRVLGYGMLASAVACALFGLSSGAAVLGLAFACNGLAQATGWPGATRAMAEHTEPRERGRVMGLWSTCYQVGGIAATALAAFLLGRAGWRAAFFVPGACLALVGVLVLRALPERAHARVLRVNGDDANSFATSAPEALQEARRRVLRSPIVYAYGACYFCIKLVRYALLFWLPYYLHTAIGFGAETSGYLSTAFEIGGVAGTVALGHLSDRMGGQRARAALCSLLGLAAALFAYAHLGAASAGMHFAAMTLVGALLFGPDALLSGAAAQEAGGPVAAATAVGIVNGTGSLGAVLQGALIVLVQQSLGWNALFYAFFGLALLAALCLLPALATPARARA